MKNQSVITCPYCGSELVQQQREYYCDFCVMNVPETLVQRNHERISVRVRDFALEVHLERTTPELMMLSTFELLRLLKYARAERTSFYRYLNTFYKARKHGNTDELKSLKNTVERNMKKLRVKCLF